MRADLAIVTGAYPPIAGGAEHQMRFVAQTAATYGYSTVVITGVSQSPQCEPSSLPLLAVDRPAGTDNEVTAGKDFFIRAVRRLAHHRPRLVLSSMLGAASAASATYARLAHVPHILRLAGGGAGESEFVSYSRTRSRRALRNFLVNNSTLLVAPAHHILKDVAAARPSQPTRLIPNGVETKHFQTAHQPRLARPPSVAWYSNGAPVKNPDLFVEVVDRCPSVQFVAVGVGALELPKRPNLTAVGWTSHVEALWSGCRVVLNTSSFEGSPNFVMQGLAAGCLALGCDNQGMRELASNYPQHVQIESMTEPERLARAVENLISSTEPTDPPPVVGEHESALAWLSLLEAELGSRQVQASGVAKAGGAPP